MKRELIINILNGYENQLSNAEINKDSDKIKFLQDQINEGNKALAAIAVYE